MSLEDLACLHAGEFLNDVIIDFYLKSVSRPGPARFCVLKCETRWCVCRYLVLEGVANAVAERTHIFSSFFFKQLSRRHTAGEEEEDCAPSVP